MSSVDAVRNSLEDPLRAWAAAGLAVILLLAAGAFAFPRRVYDEFIWQYFWGPIVADAHAVGTAGCAVREGGSVEFIRSGAECDAIRETGTAVVANPGYTTLSTVSYAIILLFALVGIVLLMDRMNLGTDRRFFYGLIPFVFFGGALRVVEDANTQLYAETGEMVIGMPWAGFIISPLIYFVVFLLAAVALLGSRHLEFEGIVDRYEYPLAASGTGLLVLTFVILGYFYVTTDFMSISLIVPAVTLGGATLITVLVWWASQRWWPEMNVGTGLMGAVVIWGHAVDGVANVLSLDWAAAVGLPRTYGPKHVVNRAIIDITSAVQPAAVSDAIGTAWPFLPVKVLVAAIVVWAFNDEVFEDTPTFAMLLFVAILAVGLGPGTRDFLRATLGI